MPATSGNKKATTYLWKCHVCGLSGMSAVTQIQCANCVHVRCPECTVQQTTLD